jgi:hypothetical protein
MMALLSIKSAFLVTSCPFSGGYFEYQNGSLAKFGKKPGRFSVT